MSKEIHSFMVYLSLSFFGYCERFFSFYCLNLGRLRIPFLLLVSWMKLPWSQVLYLFTTLIISPWWSHRFISYVHKRHAINRTLWRKYNSPITGGWNQARTEAPRQTESGAKILVCTVLLCGEMHVSTHAKLYNDFCYLKWANPCNTLIHLFAKVIIKVFETVISPHNRMRWIDFLVCSYHLNRILTWTEYLIGILTVQCVLTLISGK